MKTKEELETLKREFMSKIDLDKFKVKQMPNGKYAIIETSSIFNLIIDTNQGYYYQSPKKAVSAYYYKIKNGYDGEILTNIENYFDNYIANIL